jgi:DNA-binding transcriptional MerR regulator
VASVEDQTRNPKRVPNLPQVPDKPYFKIGEVSRLTGVEPYVLRYWESEFRIIRPEKTRTNQRMYRRRDVEAVLQIKQLLYEDGYRIDGAKRRLRELSGEEPTVQVKALAASVRELLDELEKIVDDDETS